MKIKDEAKPTSDTSVTYFSPSILGGLGRVLLISTIMGILLVPVFLLYAFSRVYFSSSGCLAICGIFKGLVPECLECCSTLAFPNQAILTLRSSRFLVPMARPMMALTSAGFIFLFLLIMSVVAEGRIYEIFVGTAT
jgi:hypothetical protein